ncbi:MAG TPA: T9SS type A sorting domain-containing protein [Adhaeribacter sp.]|nr:T9SS type A sorting domain-containing protein [Adhaeribacter sp.]
MKKFTFGLLSFLVPALQVTSAVAQTVVSETTIVRQAEGTEPAGNWVGYTRNAGTLTFVAGPDGTALGCGSLEFSTPAAADKAFLFNYDHTGTALTALTALTYSTYRTAGNAGQVAALNIVIDYNGVGVAGGEAVLVFEPVYNTSQGTVTNNTWQTWDAFNGGNAIWWSTQTFGNIQAFGSYVTWNEIVANNPAAVISGGFGINQGSGNPGLISAVDALNIGVNGATTTYNFEPATYTYYRDADGDGYGDPASPLTTCSATSPSGYVSNNTDCNDNNKNKHTGCNPASNFAVGQGQPGTITGRTAMVYPSPTSGEVNVQMPVLQPSSADIVVTDSNGTVVESRSTTANGQVETFDLRHNGPGLYLIRTVTQNGVKHNKVVVY